MTSAKRSSTFISRIPAWSRWWRSCRAARRSKPQPSDAGASSAPAPPWAQGGPSAERSSSCRDRPLGSRLPSFMPLPRNAPPSATSSCATMICCRRRVQQSVACNALHALESRLCRWLLQTHHCVDGDAIPLTQEFLGQMLGVRRTTVTIAARLLQSASLIHYPRGLIHIVDRAALEDISCECYAVVRRNTDKVFPQPRILGATRPQAGGTGVAE